MLASLGRLAQVGYIPDSKLCQCVTVCVDDSGMQLFA